MKTAEKVRLLRLHRGLTQEELGELVGVQKSAINKYEKGRVVNIKRSTLQKLADALGVAPVDLLDDDEAITCDDEGNIYGVARIPRSEQRQRLLTYFNMMDSAQADMIVKIAKSIVEEE